MDAVSPASRPPRNHPPPLLTMAAAACTVRIYVFLGFAVLEFWGSADLVESMEDINILLFSCLIWTSHNSRSRKRSRSNGAIWEIVLKNANHGLYLVPGS